MARVNTLVHDLHLDTGADHAPQGGGEPKLLVVTAATVQADNEAGVADVGLQLLDVEGEILWRNTSRKRVRKGTINIGGKGRSPESRSPRRPQ